MAARVVLIPCFLLLAPGLAAQDHGASLTFTVSLSKDAPKKAESRAGRPFEFVPLYTYYGAFNGMDMHSTYEALNRKGAREANPVLRPLVREPVAFAVAKAGGVGGMLWASERLRKKNRWLATALLTAANVGIFAVTARNYGLATRLSREEFRARLLEGDLKR